MSAERKGYQLDSIFLRKLWIRFNGIKKKLSALTKNQMSLLVVTQKGFRMAWGRWEMMRLGFDIGHFS